MEGREGREGRERREGREGREEREITKQWTDALMARWREEGKGKRGKNEGCIFSC